MSEMLLLYFRKEGKNKKKIRRENLQREKEGTKSCLAEIIGYAQD